MIPVIAYFQDAFPQLTETFVRAEIGELLRRGYPVWVFTYRRTEWASDWEFADRIVVIPDSGSADQRFQNLLTLLRERKVEYLHTAWASLAARVVVHAADALGIRFGFSCHAADLWVRGNRVEPELLGALGRHPLCVAVAVEGTRHREYVECCGVPPERVVITPNPVDCSALPGFRSAPPDALRRIITVGRPVLKKGFFHAIDAVRLLRLMGHPVELEILGGGDRSDPLGAAIADYASHFPFIRAEGMKKNRETLERIHAADALLMACMVVPHDGDSDGIPTVLAEAMLMGVPVVTTDVGSITDLVVPDETGFVSRAGDAAGLARMLMRLAALLKTPDEAAHFLDRARRHALQQECHSSVNAFTAHLGRSLSETRNPTPTGGEADLGPAGAASGRSAALTVKAGSR